MNIVQNNIEVRSNCGQTDRCTAVRLWSDRPVHCGQIVVRPTGALRSDFLLFLFFTVVGLLQIIVIIIIIIIVVSFLALINIFMYLR